MTDYGAEQAEANARLLIDMMDLLRAKKLGSVPGFFQVDPEWICPCCFREKRHIARLDKNGNLLCAIVRHHDHFGDHARHQLIDVTLSWREMDARVASFRRFSEVFICQDCNVADPAAKRIVCAPEAFSFAPHEIAAFIRVAPNMPHSIDAESVREVYGALTASMSILTRRLREMSKVI